MIPKQNNLVSNAIRKSAKGEDCTLNIAGVCNYDNSTTVLCHTSFGSRGTGAKEDDFSAFYGCSCCHDCYDGRTGHLSREDRYFYAARALVRTHIKMREKGLISVKGVK